MPDGGLMVLTCLSALMKLLDDSGVTNFETDTTFRQVDGEMNEWEVVLFLKALERAVTIVSGASAQFFERLYDVFQEVKLELAGKPVAFKRFMDGGNLLAMNSDMEAVQVLGAARSFMKTNNPEYSKLSNDTLAEEVAPEFIKLCTTHAKRAVLDFKSLVSEADYTRLMDFVYIDSADALAEFSVLVDHKAMSPWILSCLIKSQSPMKLSLVEAIESARLVDEHIADSIANSIKTGVLVHSQNDSYHCRARNATHQSTTIRKSRESHALADDTPSAAKCRLRSKC
ncbi:hypothetical protein FB451DRAFT_1398751 [Mycena latifolia]|nr:hypothetical protein FB451DRAFT_1398751 [Mycena latifolia]